MQALQRENDRHAVRELGWYTDDEGFLVLLCHQDRLVHKGGFGLRRTTAGKLQFTNPAGKCIPDLPEKCFSGNVFELLAGIAACGITTAPETPVPDWLGDEMHDDIVLHHVMQRE